MEISKDDYLLTLRSFFLVLWLIIFPIRHIVQASFYQLGFSSYIFTGTTIIMIIGIALIGGSQFVKQIRHFDYLDWSVLALGGLFCLLFTGRSNFGHFKDMILVFFVPYLTGSLADFNVNRAIHRPYIILTLIVALVELVDFITFNNHLVGLEGYWNYNTAEYLEHIQMFNPENKGVSDSRFGGGIARIDGLFGFFFTTGGYLAMASAYSFIMVRFYGGIYYLQFAIYFAALLCTTSTTSLVALLGALMFWIFFEITISNHKKVLFAIGSFVGLIVILITPVGWYIFSRLLVNLSDPQYVQAFLPFVGNSNDFSRMLLGFLPAGQTPTETDFFRLLALIGVIPLAILFGGYFRSIFKALRTVEISETTIFYRAIALASVAGLGCMIHQGIALGWPVGSTIFGFIGLLMRRRFDQNMAVRNAPTATLSHI